MLFSGRYGPTWRHHIWIAAMKVNNATDNYWGTSFKARAVFYLTILDSGFTNDSRNLRFSFDVPYWRPGEGNTDYISSSNIVLNGNSSTKSHRTTNYFKLRLWKHLSSCSAPARIFQKVKGLTRRSSSDVQMMINMFKLTF